MIGALLIGCAMADSNCADFTTRSVEQPRIVHRYFGIRSEPRLLLLAL